MKKLFVLLLVANIFSVSASAAFNWGKTGHRSTAQIATTYLKNRTQRKIKKILNGKSLALISTYGDEIKSDPQYRKYSKWHYMDIPEGKTYAEVMDLHEPNLVYSIRKCVSKLKDDNTSIENQQFYLKMLVHLVGDLNQPLHVGHSSDHGGNDIKVKWFGKNTNLHRVWDSDMINSYRMSYSELASNQAELTEKQLKAIQDGNVSDWIKESRALARKVYGSAKNGDYLGYDYMYHWVPVMREQLQKGGVRLAKILNEIYG